MSKSIRESFESDLQFEEYEAYCVKQARMAAHRSFDLLWKFGHMTRTEAYAWLAIAMSKTRAQAHIVYFNEEECKQLIDKVEQYWRSYDPNAVRQTKK